MFYQIYQISVEIFYGFYQILLILFRYRRCLDVTSAIYAIVMQLFDTLSFVIVLDDHRWLCSRYDERISGALIYMCINFLLD